MEACRRRSDGDLDATELRLGLPGTEPDEKPSPPAARAASKRALEEDAMCPSNKNESKAQVVGWPPVRPYRRNISMQMRRSEADVDVDDDKSAAAIYVKVSMDGAPYLRKIDLKVYRGYKDLRENLEDMFKCFSLGEYVITYEDKDGDWMMVGDVPWEMFVSACKRLRIMKGSEARGLGSS